VLRKMLQPVQGRFKTPMPSGQLLLWFLRVCYGAIIIGLSMAAFSSDLEAYHSTFHAYAVFLGVLCVGLFIVLTDLWLTNKQITTLSALYFGLLLGLLLGNILSMALEPFLFDTNLESPQFHMLRKGLALLITVACCYICISTLLQTKDEFRFIIPYVEFSKQIKGARPLVLDTSVIIDGRIALRAARVAKRRRQLRQAQAQPRPPRPGHAQADAGQRQD
jgi:uncharacterized protein YacL